ncbi:MAG: hypothetical protein ACAH83_19690 [Alphaproteobacteria bacterium]
MKTAMKEFQAWLGLLRLADDLTPPPANDTAELPRGTAGTAWKNQDPDDTSVRAMKGIYL